MDRARDGEMQHKLGWASLHLGRLEAKAGQMYRARQDLEVAYLVGRALGDPSLLALAATARIEFAVDRAGAELVIAQLGAIAPAVVEELTRRRHARWQV